MGNVNMEAYQVHYKGNESVADHLRQLDLDVEKAAVLPDLPTVEGKTVLTAITDDQGDTELTYETPEVESEDIAPAFSEETEYSEGDLVYYDGILYKFAADHTAGAWDPSEVTQTTVAAEFNQLKNTISGLTTILVEDTASVTGDGAAYKTFEIDLSKDGYELLSITYNIGNLDYLVAARLRALNNKRVLRGDVYRKDGATFSNSVSVLYGAVYLKRI